MGLTDVAKRAALSILFLCSAGLAYLIGDQLGALENSRAPTVSFVQPFKGERIRAELTQALQDGELTINDPRIEMLARQAPIDVVLFEYAMSEALMRGDSVKAEQMAVRAIDHQPRSLAARLHLLSTAVEKNDVKAVFQQYEALVRLRSLNDNLLSDALIGLFREQGDWRALIDYLETVPPNGELITQKLMQEDIADDRIERLLETYPDLLGAYLQKLTRQGALQKARVVWLGNAKLSEGEQRLLPFNGDFASRPQLPPFNWKLLSNRAEFQNSGGLHVTYLGSGSPAFVEQTIQAAPGSYLMRTMAKGRMPRAGGSLQWTVTCKGEKSPLVEMEIVLRRNLEVETFVQELEIPDEQCDFQNIQLLGRSGNFPKTSRTELVSIEILPINSER